MLIEIHGPDGALRHIGDKISAAMDEFDNNPAVAAMVAGAMMAVDALGKAAAASLLRMVADAVEGAEIPHLRLVPGDQGDRPS